MDWWHGEWWTALLDRFLGGRSRTTPPLPSAAGYYWPGTDCAGYAALYKTQPHVRSVVDFLSSQLGQLGVQVFRRLSDTDRVRVHDHPLARLMRAPNPGTTRYLWMNQTVQDWCVYGNAYSVKVRRPNRLELYRVLPTMMRPHGDLIPRAYTWSLPNGQTAVLDAGDVFHLREYNPDDPLIGLSRLETLRKILAEEAAATNYREWFWLNGAKLAGWIGRPKEAPRWTEQQRDQFRTEWQQFQGPRNSGKTAVLEDGMAFNPITATARDSELTEARKLSREEVAAAFHVPPAMMGILDAQGYGSLREQHKVLYQDTLGPTVALLEGELERQLLPEFSDSEDVYVQFNIAEKLQGSFEEEQNALNSAVGSPYMSRNEARARLNLSRINDQAFDQPVTRLDIAEGQQINADDLSITDRIDALGGLVRAGFDPAESLAALDLPPIKHLGLPPVTVQPEPDPAPANGTEPAALAARMERALRVLPAELAARLPVPATPARVTRARRGSDGRIEGLEEFAADGTRLTRRALIRDAEGRVVEVADAIEDAD